MPSNAQNLTSNLNTAANQISMLAGSTLYNNAWSASQAQIQREWQEKQNAKAMSFSASEAAKNRDWQQMMSNTAHQREIKDLQAAGLNPILSAMGGNGAAVGSGATASGVTSSGSKGDTDTSINSALVNLLGSVYSRTTQLEAANINARTQEAVADKYTATSQIVADISAAASRYAADRSNDATKYAADRNDYRAMYELANQLIGDIGNGNSYLGRAVSSGVDKAKEVSNKVANSQFGKSVSDWYKSSELKKGVDSVKNYFGF